MIQDYVRRYEEIGEIPKSQRYVSRPTLEKLFMEVGVRKDKRDLRIVDAVMKWGYHQKEVADYLELHYSTISRLLKEANLKISKLKT
jgi:transposase